MSSGRHRAGSACSSPERCVRRNCAIDGLKVRLNDGPMLTDIEFARALRTLAQMMVGNHDARSDQQAINAELGSASPLTRAAIPRTDHTDEAA